MLNSAKRSSSFLRISICLELDKEEYCLHKALKNAMSSETSFIPLCFDITLRFDSFRYLSSDKS